MFFAVWQRYPFLRLLLPLTVGIVCGDAAPHVLSWPLSGAVVGILLLALGVCHRYAWQRAFGGFVCLLLGFAGHQLASFQWEKSRYDFSSQKVVCLVRIREMPEEKPRSILCPVGVEGVFAGDSLLADARRPAFLFYFHKDSLAARLERGDVLLVRTRLTPPKNFVNPEEFDYVRYLRRQGVSGTAYVPAGCWQVVGHDSVRTLRQVALDYREQVIDLYGRLGFVGDDLALLSALTVGDQDDLSESIVETYAVAGASHVLSLSGLHIGFLYALLLWMLRPLWRWFPWLKLPLLLGVVVALWGFAFFTGLASPVVRSVCMITFVALASLQLEKLLTLNSLAAAAFLMLLVCPLWLFDVSSQLSFVSLAAILLFQPPLYKLWKPKNCFLRYVWGLLTVSAAAQIGAAPLVLLYFSRFSTHFLLSNLWVVPMSSLVLYAAVVLLALTPLPVLQQGFAPIVKGLLHLQNGGLRLIERLPFASFDGIKVDVVDVFMFYIVLALFWRCGKRFTPQRIYVALTALLLGVLWHAFVGQF